MTQFDPEIVKVPEAMPTAPLQYPEFHLRQTDFVVGTAFQGGSSRSRMEVCLWSFAALLIDLLACFGAALLLSAVLIYSSGNRGSFLLEANASSFLALYAVLVFNYLLIFRAFLGFSLGEWACHLRMGLRTDYDSANYLIRVLLRTLLVFLSFGVIPIASLLLKRDLAGEVTGLKVRSLK